MKKEIDDSVLDKIIRNTMGVMEDSKEQIFEIYESARNEVAHLHDDLMKIRRELEILMKKSEKLKHQEKASRQHLMEVSKSFKEYTEEDIKRCYEQTKDLQVQVAVISEKENSLVLQRNIIEFRLKDLQKTVGRAKKLVSQVGVVLGYLTAEMGEVAAKVEAVNNDKLLAPMVIKAQEDERLRVSREIHDGPAQLLANVMYRSSVCEELISKDIDHAKLEIKGIREHLRTCLAETRKIIFDLRPMTLDDLGLIATLYHFIHKFEERTGIVIEFNVIGEELNMKKHIEIGLFRVIQEALNNIQKHAQVKLAKIVLEYNPEYVSVVIADEGCGFKLTAFQKNCRENESYGILGMEERIKILKGQMNIVSKPKKGTKLKIIVPLVETE